VDRDDNPRYLGCGQEDLGCEQEEELTPETLRFGGGIK
jgi:hypothetical protein